jgi:hypothetical protein
MTAKGKTKKCRCMLIFDLSSHTVCLIKKLQFKMPFIRETSILSTIKNVDRKFVDKICRKKNCRFDKFEFRFVEIDKFY